MNQLLIHGDCLEQMQHIPDGIVDMVFADLPYGVTANKWDVVIPFEPLWEHLLRVGKRNCAFVFTATQPFATSLICSQRKLFRYDLVWQKTMATGFFNAAKMPLRAHEHCLIFYKALPVYNPIKTKAIKRRGKLPRETQTLSSNYGKKQDSRRIPWTDNGLRYPISCLHIAGVSNAQNCHPTQKPVALLEWLIKNYSNPGDVILDPVMGSGTTGVASKNTGRDFIGIEKDETYFNTAQTRMRQAA